MEEQNGGQDVRWKQRFENFKKAHAVLKRGLAVYLERELSELERGGLVQAFEFTQEFSWKVLKDYLAWQGDTEVNGSRDAYRKAFNAGLIANGDDWMQMIKARNLSGHTYDEEDSIQLVMEIADIFEPCFVQLEERFERMQQRQDSEAE